VIDPRKLKPGVRLYTVVRDDSPCGMGIGECEVVSIRFTPKTERASAKVRGIDFTARGREEWIVTDREMDSYHETPAGASDAIIRAAFPHPIFGSLVPNDERPEAIVARAESAIAIWRKEHTTA